MSSKASAKARRSASASQGAPVEARAKPQRPSTAESTSSARRVSAPATVIVAEHQLGKRVKVLAAEKWHFGTVRFNGTTSFATGSWIGVELDDAVGKNDGTVQEVTYFTCAAKHGLFCRPAHVHSDEPAVPKPKPVVKETKVVVKEADRAQLAECKTIIDATRAGLLRAVQRFLHDDPAAVRSADENGRTALHFATLNRHGNIVKELLAARAAQVADHDGETPLHHAVLSGRGEIVQQLLAARAGMEENKNRRTPLDYAQMKGCKDLVALLSSVAECKTINEAARAGLLGAVQRFLHADPAAVRKADDEGRTALHFAALNRHVDIVKELLAARAVQAADNDGETPLHHAVLSGRVEIVEALLAARAATEAETIHGRTVLSYAQMRGCKEVLEALSADAKLVVNCSFDKERGRRHFWQFQGDQAERIDGGGFGGQLLVSQESATSGIIQWLLQSLEGNERLIVGAIPAEKAGDDLYLARDGHWGVKTPGIVTGPDGVQTDAELYQRYIEVIADLDEQTLKVSAGENPESLVEVDARRISVEGAVKLALIGWRTQSGTKLRLHSAQSQQRPEVDSAGTLESP